MPEAEQQGDSRGAAQAGGFSLHVGIDIQPHQRPKLERLCRCVSRPPVCVDRMALTSSGQVRFTLKTAPDQQQAELPLGARASPV